MGLEFLKMTAFIDGSFMKPSDDIPIYTVMINPNSIKWNRKITYSNKQPLDSSTSSQKYRSTPSVELNFDIIIDCTGVVDASRLDMSTEIRDLELVVYTYNGKIHRPNYVRIQWGQGQIFDSVLKSFNTEYTLFKPNGDPLRAKVSLSFGEYIAPKKAKKKEKKKSPDITHLVEVIEGENLPQLSSKIWETPNYYIQVAQYNDLNKFRNLKGGLELVFPPIIKPE
ncbi:MAG: hypothetical protein ACI9Y7_000195 [Dokdonia sp.]|jgi:hypothetical protein